MPCWYGDLGLCEGGEGWVPDENLLSGRTQEGVEIGAVVVCVNGRENLKGQGQGGTAILGGDDRLRTGADSVEEGFQFEAQGFVLCDGQFVQAELRRWVVQAWAGCGL